MEDLVPLFQSTQDRNGVLHSWLVHHYRLETPLQSLILLDILAVLVESSCADTVELAPCQHRLEQIAGVHGSVSLSGAHDRVELIDEQQDLAVAVFDLIENSLQSLLELAPVLCTCNEGAHIQRENLSVLQAVGHVPCDYSQGKTLGNGGLSDTGLTDENRVVLCLSGEDPDHVADLAVTADNRIQLSTASQVHQLLAVLSQNIVGVLRVFAGDSCVSPNAHQGAEEAVPRYIKGSQQR